MEATAGPISENLEPSWRARIAADLSTLADAWDAPDAWDGMTQAGGQDLPARWRGESPLMSWSYTVGHRPGDWSTLRVRRGDIGRSRVHREHGRDGNDGDMPGLFGPVVPVADNARPSHESSASPAAIRWTP